ncbi:cobaltochelatase subunit CobN [Jannaschia seohaensis]|uniref:Cobaltochelatase subunit CobN n=1 Tax=Jannaschia seohaensis TaxID=475081 RepID=A0A2Y9A495_9RHOB|nr:cobaltochelatase subunit CobN [Jannaschia seohaensis]PWJ22428.1 cobaltochelatase CobN [Jannaschia seohaensis]SSA38706.1 cobaltochelatase CobN [Jannaschia seohaensis]
MHLLAAQPGAVDDGEPVDLGQTPADLVVISAADTELAMLSAARAEMEDAPSLRLASLMHLRHPMSVDLHLDACATRSRLVVARVLGGRGYWTYGLEQYAARLHEAGVPFAALPGDDKPDAELRELSTVSAEDYDALWACLIEGGPANAATFLAHAKAMLDDAPRPAPARPLLRAGLYWPGAQEASMADLRAAWTEGAAVVPVIFYRALLQGAGLNPVNRLVRALLRAGLNPMPVFVASLKDPVSAATLEALFRDAPPDAILNLTSFAVGDPEANPLAQAFANGAPVFQGVLSGGTEQAWEEGTTGLSARDIAMNVALPELDGRVLTRALGFKGEAFFDEATQCPIATWKAHGDRIAFTAELLAAWCRLRRLAPSGRRVALILANYPNRDGRLANGVGLDTPAATVHVLRLLAEAGYAVDDLPDDSAALMERLLAGPTNWLTDRAERAGGEILPLDTYRAFHDGLPFAARTALAERWGAPEDDPFFDAERGGFALSIHRFGNATVGLQPARGYNVDPTDSYHSPDLIPPHGYLAFYAWLRANSDAIVHMGKHGNLEWLPGRALALGAEDWPEIALGPMPHVYPFIVNDPGEGTQAKRRAQAVIVDHLTPPLTRAESYGPMRDLEALVDEYYEAAGLDPRRIDTLREQILSLASVTGLDVDAGFDGADDLAKLDAYLCELKEAQIRDGLHVFGQSPEGDLERDLLIALVRLPRGDGPGQASLIRALAEDCGVGIDPLDCDMAASYDGPRHKFLRAMGTETWRSNGDTVERLEALAVQAVQWRETPKPFTRTAPVLEAIHGEILPALRRCGPAEGEGLLTALSGHFVAPAPSGAPTRGRPDVLPTGRNFFSVDSRAVPTPTAWKLGWKSANLLIERHLQDHGDWPRTMLLTAWGTANMRTGGDDIAQALALMGVKPRWDSANRRVVGWEIIPHTALGRPRVDVTLRVSGFFRDAFPQQMALVDGAARAVQALEEPEEVNPAAARARAGEGAARVYGSKPGAYGAGLQAMIDERLWDSAADLGAAYIDWGGYAYGTGEGRPDHAGLRQRLGQIEAIVQNQDNREHDLLDSDDYYQFEGGAAAAVEMLQGAGRPVYHNDHSRPERPVIRTLEEEIGRVVRSRVVNPKWIAGVQRHGYKGAFEIAATVDYLFAFAATTGAVRDHHFDLVAAAVLEDDAVRDWIGEVNAPALADIADRLSEAIARGLWTPRSNSARGLLDRLRRS